MTQENTKRIHPYKFTLWVAMGSIIMMFAGFTSAYIVKRNQTNWQGFELPLIFYYSSVVIIVSSITMRVAGKYFKSHQMLEYRRMLLVTAFLGAVFLVMQWLGFISLQESGIKLIGPGSNVSGSFLAVIAGVHMAHVLGGIIALIFMYRRSFSQKTRHYSRVGIEVMSTYWHFVDILWIYLFIFLSFVS